ncbi:MAG: DUF4252 domain-containing protein [Bacteroidales bacterium]|nr:DUF4252 domain-containing protein [Bacteroidales bacterium]
MRTSKVQRFVFLLMVPVLLSLWGCSRYHVEQTLKSYSHKPGFELKVINTDSISSHSEHLGMVFKYLKGVKEIYILTFNSEKGSSAENMELRTKLKKYISSANFETLIDVQGETLVGLYLQKNDKGTPEQVIFMKSGGKNSVYVWAPNTEKTD